MWIPSKISIIFHPFSLCPQFTVSVTRSFMYYIRTKPIVLELFGHMQTPTSARDRCLTEIITSVPRPPSGFIRRRLENLDKSTSASQIATPIHPSPKKSPQSKYGYLVQHSMFFILFLILYISCFLNRLFLLFQLRYLCVVR